MALPKSNWRILVDECTNFNISHFFHRKDQMAEATCKLLKAWKDKGIMKKLVWMDKRARIGSWEFRLSTPKGIHHSTIILRS